jgi:hypothetical protein
LEVLKLRDRGCPASQVPVRRPDSWRSGRRDFEIAGKVFYFGISPLDCGSMVMHFPGQRCRGRNRAEDAGILLCDLIISAFSAPEAVAEAPLAVLAA